jgi:2-polyprenyl-3-methyl-5-hydroxy-6-metoxy-1,4-benzoquinol methylase
MLDVLEHMDQPEVDLTLAMTMLRPAGLVMVTVPAFQLVWTAHDDLNHHRRRYTSTSLTELVHGAGAHVDSMRYFFH